MSWIGYFSFGGTEIVNVDRTERYARGIDWLRPAYSNGYLAALLGEPSYANPVSDMPDWVDPDDPNSLDYYGAYPISVVGLDDSSRAVSITERIGDGAVAGKSRRASLSLVFSVGLVAGSDLGLEYGIRWLTSALAGGPCDDGCTEGQALCFLSTAPFIDSGPSAVPTLVDAIIDGGSSGFSPSDIIDGGDSGPGPFDILDGNGLGGIPSLVPGGTVDDAEDCLPTYLRSLYGVHLTNGPVINSKRVMGDGTALAMVSFTLVATNPYVYAAGIDAITGFLDPAILDPWPGVVPDGLVLDPDGTVIEDAVCVAQVAEPLYDPLCPASISPPSVPDVPIGCFTPPVNWLRRSVSIPREVVPAWGYAIPEVRVKASVETRNVRLRLYPDAEGDGDINAAPCSFCADIVVSYIPEGHTMVIDGVTRSIYAENSLGERRRADSLLFTTEGKPISWPELSCGFGYVLAVDTPQTPQPPIIDVVLHGRVA